MVLIPMAEENADRQWHLDKKVPLALIFTIAAQTLAIVWWSATANARLDHLERQVNASAPQSERIIRLEAKMDAVADAITEVKSFFKRPALP